MSEPNPRSGGPQPHRPTLIDAAETWQPLRLLNLFRIFLAIVCLVQSFWDGSPLKAGMYSPALFLLTSLAYLAYSLAAFVTIRLRYPRFRIQAYLHAVADIVAMTLLLHAAGGTNSGFGIILIITVAGTALMLYGLSGTFVAAAASLAILGEQLLVLWSEAYHPNFTHAGLLGTAYFATALLLQTLSRRLQESEHLAEQRGIDLANMAQLNEHIIQQLDSGVLVVDGEHRIRLINQAAWQMLGLSIVDKNRRLDESSPALAAQLSHWRGQQDYAPAAFSVAGKSGEWLPDFHRLGTRSDSGTLIFLHDTSQMAQQAQQLKLASLGRLTASIAHEIRNPLGAISHAAQLLAEPHDQDDTQQRLTQIIGQHCKRMNTIIEDILQLGRRSAHRPEPIPLAAWLERFGKELSDGLRVTPADIEIDITPPDIIVEMDAGQLHQILWNLCENGLYHSRHYPGQPRLEIRGGITRDISAPFLDIIDHGPGIPPEVARHIFEPFFTTEQQGTGLGLYISRELCENNRARLEYLPVPSGGSCFRILFTKPTLNRTTGYGAAHSTDH